MALFLFSCGIERPPQAAPCPFAPSVLACPVLFCPPMPLIIRDVAVQAGIELIAFVVCSIYSRDSLEFASSPPRLQSRLGSPQPRRALVGTAMPPAPRPFPPLPRFRFFPSRLLRRPYLSLGGTVFLPLIPLDTRSITCLLPSPSHVFTPVTRSWLGVSSWG